MALTRKSFLSGAGLAGIGLALSACGSSAGTSADASGTGAEGATIDHAFGTTHVPADATRIASVNWGNQDVVLALGLMPVGFAKQTWGVEDGSGMLPWTKQKVDELVGGGAQAPALFDETDSIDFEAVSATAPDVILAAYSGITQEDYDTLSKIAPTVAHPGVAWSTPWREMITMDSTAIGRKSEGEALVADLEKQISDLLAAHPGIKGKRAAFFYAAQTDLSSIGYYTTADPRTAFLADLGMPVPDSVRKASEADPSTFYTVVSSETVDSLSDVDVMVMYGKESDLEAYRANPLIGTIPAIKNGSVAFVGDSTPLAASTNPGPLSIPWGLKDYVALIAAAADKAR